MHQNPLEGLLKHKQLSPTPRVLDSVGPRWDLRICMSNKFPGDADAADLWTTGRATILVGRYAHLRSQKAAYFVFTYSLMNSTNWTLYTHIECATSFVKQIFCLGKMKMLSPIHIFTIVFSLAHSFFWKSAEVYTSLTLIQSPWIDGLQINKTLPHLMEEFCTFEFGHLMWEHFASAKFYYLIFSSILIYALLDVPY